MRRPALLLAFALAAAMARADSGLSAEIRLAEPALLPGEQVLAGVRLTNLSGQPVTFGAAPEWLTFFVTRPGGGPVSQTAPLDVSGEFTLESATAGTKQWDIAPAFDLTEPGSYSVIAEVRVPSLGVTLVTPPQNVLVSPGMTLAEVTFGRPAPAGGTPEVRRYSLVQAQRRKDLRLFVRVSDESGARALSVTPIERLLSVSRPEHQLDRESNLHILLQSGARDFSYVQLNPDGEIVGRRKYVQIPGTRPRLAAGTNGVVTVAGGARVPQPTDLPPAAVADPAQPAVGTEPPPPAP
ncbi:MAG: hypothetical protein ACKVYV_17635 [Limisphaerales bacterium]